MEDADSVNSLTGSSTRNKTFAFEMLNIVMYILREDKIKLTDESNSDIQELDQASMNDFTRQRSCV